MMKLAGIVPHSPVLVPNIGKENHKLLSTTLNSFSKITEKIKKEKIETIIFISAHGNIKEDFFSINLNEKFEINFEEFGDFTTKAEVACDLELTQSIREATLRFKSSQMINEPVLDHGVSIPLFLMLPELKDIKIVSLSVSGTDLPDHFEFGKKIAEKIKLSKKNIAIFSSGDLSHCLNKKAPAGYFPKGVKLDQKLIEQLKEKDTRNILQTSKDLMGRPMACAPRAISVLLGVLDKSDYNTNILSYEAPFGVGNLTALFELF